MISIYSAASTAPSTDVRRTVAGVVVPASHIGAGVESR
jgi:hypothetical protein